MDLNKQITYYLNGELTEKEAEELWIELLKQPEYIDLLEVELWLSIYFRRS